MRIVGSGGAGGRETQLVMAVLEWGWGFSHDDSTCLLFQGFAAVQTLSPLPFNVHSRWNHLHLQAVVYNNLACLHRKLQQSDAALAYLQRATELEAAALDQTAQRGAEAKSHERSGSRAEPRVGVAPGGGAGSPEPGGTQQLRRRAASAPGEEDVGAGAGAGGPGTETLLNLAACSSAAGRHEAALAYSEQAVAAAGRELAVSLPELEAALGDGLPLTRLCEVLPVLRRPGAAAAGTRLAMSYFNRAVECEHLQRWAAAGASYGLAVGAAARFAGRCAEVTMTMQQSAEVRGGARYREHRVHEKGKGKTCACIMRAPDKCNAPHALQGLSQS